MVVKARRFIPWRTASFRLTATVTALFLLACLGVVGAIYWSVSDLLLRQAIDDIALRSSRLEAALKTAAPSEIKQTLDSLAEARDDGLYIVTDTSRARVLAGNLPNWPLNFPTDGRADIFEYSDNGNPVMAVGMASRLAGGRILLVARKAKAQQVLTARMRWIVVAGGGLIIGLGILAGLALGYFVIRRIDAISRAGDAFIQGDLAVRVPLSGADDELDDLARTLNHMLGRIAQLMSGMREVSDNIAHDLKTPLNRLRIRAEGALDDRLSDQARRDALAGILAETDDIIRTFNALLQVARLEVGVLDKSPETFDLAALVRDIAELYEPVAEEAGATLEVSTPPTLCVSAHRQLIGQAITNLLENGLKYGCDDSCDRRELGIRLVVDEGEIAISVADRGPGIAVPDRQRALERFVRLDASRTKPGTGLGLSLVAAVARGHGGRVLLLDNEPGLVAQFRLPASLLVARTEPAECHQRFEEIA
jgi:signal transduction histidine kinase